MKTFDHVQGQSGWVPGLPGPAGAHGGAGGGAAGYGYGSGGWTPGGGPGYATVPATSDAKAYLRLLLDHKLGLVLAGLLGLGLAWIWLIGTQPVYEASALVEVIDRGDLLGNEVQQTGTDWNAPTIEEERNRLRSRRVLQPVIDSAGLRIAAWPRKVPVLSDLSRELPFLGDFIAGFDAARPYAWGKTDLRVLDFEVPPRLEDATFTLVSLGEGDYTLRRGGRTLVERASAGERLQIDLPGTGDSLRISVGSLEARPGVEFSLRAASLESSLRYLRGRLSTDVSDSKSRMITVKLQGEDPERAAELVNRIVEEYQSLKLGAQNAQANTRLEFFEGALPGVEGELREAEQTLSSFRTDNASYDEDKQTGSKLAQLADLESQRTELVIERNDNAEKYTDLMPTQSNLIRRISVLDRQIAQLSGSIRTRPDTQRDLTVLEEDVDAKRTVYNEMNAELQRLRIALSGTVGSVEIIDPALAPRKPVSPNGSLAYVAGILATLFLYLLWLTLRSALSSTITDQESLERASGLRVYMNIPKSAAQRRIASSSIADPRRLLPGTKGGKGGKAENVAASRVLALANPEDYSVENLRGLRSMLEDVMAGADNNVLMVTSPLPNMGKSFVSLNLAVLIAQAGRRVLLIDADYQRGQVHKELGLPMGPGLPEVVRGKSELRETVRATSVPNLYCIPRGFSGAAGPSAGGEMPTDKEFATFMRVVAPRFDIAIIDTPPVLSVATAASLGRHAGSTIMVVKEGELKEQQLSEALKRLTFSGVRVSGCILNGSSTPTPRHYAYYRERLD